ncbi:LysM peptidoglycan-binding domain-containing protein [Peribacillus asahii]|uniref:LysM peptidoglycan-binding domain-containing protein n=1 Tax=Peribacillus asahii TaxID=228899 RepID=UPI0020796308|nr:LysM peptidoglycan-binding domain-containing protein [Peribacillus asahii]USK59203.1 LysM peptidoglycan-binding domain-containing protein [Peribacillus asahii]
MYYRQINYIVQPGDSLDTISQKFETNAERIKDENQLTSNIIYIGQQLVVPVTAERNIYIVQPGDSLYTIAMKFGVSIGELQRINQLRSNIIYVGQQFVIPEEIDEDYYVVQEGDSLSSIAQRFETTVGKIKTLNNLDTNIIYINQRLKVSEIDERQTEYVVKSGDSLYEIARRYNTIVESILVLNHLESMNLTVGQRIKIPEYSEVIVNIDGANVRQRPGSNFRVIAQMDRGARLPLIGVQGNWYKVVLFNGNPGWISKTVSTLRAYDGSDPIIQILGYYTLSEGPTLPSSYQSFVTNTKNISQNGLFLFRISKDNPTTIDKFGNFTDEEVRNLVRIGHRHNVKMLATVHNLLYAEGVELAKQVIHELVSSEQNMVAFAENLVRLVERYGLDGVDIDIEDVLEEDRDRLTQLYRVIGRVFDARGYFFSTAVPSKTGPGDPSVFAKPFDYPKLHVPTDQFVIMLYNEHGWPGSGPGPVVSIGRMEKVLRYAITVMPKEKIVAAVSVFGFDFNLQTGRAAYASFDRAMTLARQYNKEIIFDEETKTPMFAYTDEQGVNHEVWFENRASIKAKAELADRLGIRGLALWRLGMEDEGMWDMLENEVVVRKSGLEK